MRFARTNTFNDPLDGSSILFPFDWENFDKVDPKVREKIIIRNNEIVFSTIFVCSFSKTYFSKKSYLMWSHYANSHSQLCFEIDFSKIKYLGGPSEVNYPDNLSEKRMSLDDKLPELGLFVMTNKSKVWKYEKEVRLIFDTKVGDKGLIKNYSKDSKHLFINFEPQIISKIVFGANASENDISKTVKLFNDINHYPIYEQMVISPKSLKLIPEKLSF